MGDTAPSTFHNRRRFLGMTALAAGSALLAGCEDPKPADPGFKAQPASSTPLPAVEPVAALNTVLAVEHQAIFTYGAVARLLGAAEGATAAGFRRDHEAHRDAVSARVTALGGMPAAAKPTYDITPAPTDQAGALKVLATVEDTAGKTYYRMLAGTSSGELRTFLMSIMANEGQHSAILLAATGQSPVPAPYQSA